jgi:hypothetical protein
MNVEQLIKEIRNSNIKESYIPTIVRAVLQ